MMLTAYQTVLTQGLEEIDKTKITPRQWQVLNHLRDCRTERMGSYDWHCNQCGHDVTWYCSCRDRHCPSCQAQMREKWLLRRKKDILPVAYHHLVFTLPHEFNGLAKLDAKAVYDCLFRSVWLTLQAFANGRHHLEGQLGVIMVLHTWGRNLSQHIHIHCLVPGGVLTTKREWKATRKESYLFPVKALSVRFKKNMLKQMKSELPESESILWHMQDRPWVVYSKPVIDKAEAVVNYLSRYCNRVGINPAQLHHAKDKVQMTYKDYRSEKAASMVCSAGEILRRLLLHVLPKGFMRIRYYGFMANAVRVKSVELIRTSLEATPLRYKNGEEKSPVICPCCGAAEMIMVELHLRPAMSQPIERPG
jgi:hypothetical protein